MANPTQPSPRLASLDALRGLAMLFMATGGLGFAAIAANQPDSAFWAFLKYHTTHAAWIDRKSTRLNSSHIPLSRMPSSA